MATNKNQHFVPRCYLRQFAQHSGKTVNLFNIISGKHIDGAPLKNQCSKPYFYGKDPPIEPMLQDAEGSYAELMKSMLNPAYIMSKEDAHFLKGFCLLQYLRTETAAKQCSDWASTAFDVELETPQSRKVFLAEMIEANLQAYQSHRGVLDRLHCVIAKNVTTTPFITSDDPVAFTNRAYITSTNRNKVAPGLASAGAILMLPLSPGLLFVIYDKQAYEIVTSKPGIVRIAKDADVLAFNRHQHLNCSENLYFKTSGDIAHIKTQHAQISPLRIPWRHSQTHLTLAETKNGQQRWVKTSREEAEKSSNCMLHTENKFPDPKVWPSQIIKRSSGKLITF